MFRYTHLLVSAAVFQVISSQIPPGPPPNFADVPEQCRGPPRDISKKPHECCKIPPFFLDEDFEECGFKKEPKPEMRQGPPDCTKQMCLLKKYSLIDEKEEINHDSIRDFMDKWAVTNPAFKPAVDTAKERCVGKVIPGPPDTCQPNILLFCVSSTIFAECPVWEEDEGCQKIKSHLDECKKYFPH